MFPPENGEDKMETVQGHEPQSRSAEQPSELRELGFYERFRVTVHDLGFHFNVSIVARFSHQGKLAGTIRQLVFSAFEEAIRNHPALGVVVVQNDTRHPRFARLDCVDLDKAITFRISLRQEQERLKTLETLFAEENSRGFTNGNQPLWRAIVLEEDQSLRQQTFSIAFIWHHVIGDGRSGLAVLSTLADVIRSYQPPSNDNPSDVKTNEDWLVRTSPGPLLPPMEEALSLSASSKSSIENGDPLIGNTTRYEKIDTNKWSGGHYNYQSSILTDIRCIKVPEVTTRRLAASCRRERTTMTALLQAVMGKVLFSTTGADQIRAACAISLRRFFPPQLGIDDSVMGLWISAFCTDYNRLDFQSSNDTSAVWRRARDNTQRINFEIEKGDRDIDIAALRHIDDYKQNLLGKEGTPRENSFGLTNLGVFPATTSKSSGSSGWDVSDVVFSQSCHANGSAIQICIVTLQGGDMNVVLNWQRGIITNAFVDEIAKSLQAEFVELSSCI